MAFVYLDIEGNEHDKKDWDLHHAIPRCRAKSPNVYDRFISIAGFIGDLAVTTGNSNIREQCERISNNFALQAPFILLGQIERVEV